MSESPEEMLDRTKRTLLWFELAEKYIFPHPNSIRGLAGRLNVLLDIGSVEDKPEEPDSFAHVEYLLRHQIAKELETQIGKASYRADSAFFDRLAKACKLAKKDVHQPLKAIGAAVYAFQQFV